VTFALAALAGEALPGVDFLAAAFPLAVPFARDPVLLAADVPVDSALRDVPEAAAPGRLTAFLTGSTPPLGESSTTSGSGPSDAAAEPGCFVLEGWRESPVLMLMLPRHGRLSGTARGGQATTSAVPESDNRRRTAAKSASLPR
jgi:hypothetical protein